MGSYFSRGRQRAGRSNPRAQMDEDLSDLTAEGEGEEPDLSMVLALLLRSGQVHLRYTSGYDSSEAEDEDDDCTNGACRTSGDNDLQEPDTIKESDLMQEIYLNSGKLYNSGRVVDLNDNIVNALKTREISCCGANRKGAFTRGCRTSICATRIPNEVVRTSKLGRKVFCGTFSENGNMFLSACQDGHLRIYRTDSLKRDCVPFRDISGMDIGWSILDTAFSPDSRFLTYSTWSNDIFVAAVEHDETDPTSHVALDLRPVDHNFAIFSLQFSADGSEILGGSNDGHLYICNRDLHRRTSRIDAHEDDVNAVCFADASSHILYSGGDDGLVHVWDRRTLVENDPQSVGTFAGHLDGITFIDSRLDARYLLSNSKDQTVKLWDLRKFSSAEAQDAVKTAVARQSWDYRWHRLPRKKNAKATVHGDTSLKTYHGHKVMNTLLRARFSPMHTTGQKYIYCGCSTGKVIVYDILSGDIVSQKKEHRQCVRDVSWHPYEQTLVTSSWDGSFKVWDHKPEEGPVRAGKKRKHASKGQGDDDDDEKPGETSGPAQRRTPRLATAR